MLLLCLITISISNAQSFVQKNYAASDEVIGNPERGFYHQINNVSDETLQGFKSEGVKLVLINYSLKGFHNKPLSTDFLRKLENDFSLIRKNGFKIIPRFAYSFTGTNPIADAPLEFVLLHIEQIKNIIRSNSDVILTFQAGFIGTWGEWWNTKNFSEVPGHITEENWIDRRKVVDALLDMMPDDRMVQLRTPEYKKEILQANTYIAVSQSEAYDAMMSSRLAHHNDCFVAGNNDYGTYKNPTIQKPYLALDSKYVIVGGETCNKSGESNCVNALKELKQFHWSFLNLDYHQGVLAQWISEGCYDEVERKLGYRYELSDANLQTNGKPNGEIKFTLNITNTGWANPTNPYQLELILKNSSDNTTYKLQLDDDVRLWPIGESYKLAFNAGLPEVMEQGVYKMSIAIKDKRLSLTFNPDYSIQFANTDIWDATEGVNSLNNNITITEDNSLPTYTGNHYFVKEGTITGGFSSPQAIEVTQYNDNNIIYWTKGGGNPTIQNVRLQRSVNNGVFQTIAIKNLNDIAHIDNDLENNSTYSYRVQYIEIDRNSEYIETNITKSNPVDKNFLAINIDGEKMDWNIVKPIATGYQNGMVSLRMANDADTLFFSIRANEINKYQLVLSTNDESKFKISNDSLYQDLNNVLTFIEKISTNRVTNFIEGKISLLTIKFLSSTLKGKLIINDSVIWGQNDDFSFLKNKVLLSPENFKVIPSVTTPLTKVKVSWKFGTNLDGYVLERSIGDKNNYEVIKELGSGNNYYLDKNLDATLTYYYRIFSYSDIIRSAYTDDISIKLEGYNATNNLKIWQSISIYPNPSNENTVVHIEVAELIDCQIKLYDNSMRYLRTIYSGQLSKNNTIAIQRNNLEKGMYFLSFQTQHNTSTKKLVFY